MKFLKALLGVVFVIGLTFSLNNKRGAFPPLGKFLDPFHGFLSLVNSDIHTVNNFNFNKIYNT